MGNKTDKKNFLHAWRNWHLAAFSCVASALALFFLTNGLWLWFHHENVTLAACIRDHSAVLPFKCVWRLLWLVPPAALAWFAARHDKRHPHWSLTHFALSDREAALPVLMAALSLFLVSGIASHPWFYFLKWMPAGYFSFLHGLSCLEITVLFAILLTPLMFRPRRLDGWLVALLVVAQILAAIALFKTTHGLPLYRDDHPSFLFRLHEFAHTFPRRIDYNPCWNAGVVNWTSTSSGTTGPGLLFLPFWRWMPVHRIYTPIFAILFIGVMPWLAAAAARAVRASWSAAAIAGLLALCPSRYFFLWLLHFGTIGSCFAISFFPLFAALTYRILVLRLDGWRTLLAWILSAFFLVQWPPGAIMAAFLVPGALFTIRRWRWPSIARLAIAAVILALLMLPSVLLTLTQGKELLDYVGKDAAVADPVRAAFPPFGEWKKFLLDTLGKRLVEANPLLVFFGIAGAFALPWKQLRRWFSIPVLLLLLLAAWGPLIARRMQLERMALPAIQLAIVPAALWIAAALRGGRPLLAVPRALILALLVMGVANTRQLYRAKGYAPFTAMPTQISTLADWTRSNVPPDGRLMFLGKNVHTYGGGHIAYLPVLAEREMMASDYYGFPPGMIDEKYPPRAYRANDAMGVHCFARLHRITHVVACREGYIEEFKLRQAPGLFRECTGLNGENLFVFEVLDTAESLFHKGTGSIRATFNRIDVEGLDGQDEVVIRYNWDDRLRVASPVEIFPVDIENGIRFIGIRPNGVNRVTIGLAGIL